MSQRSKNSVQSHILQCVIMELLLGVKIVKYYNKVHIVVRSTEIKCLDMQQCLETTFQS